MDDESLRILVTGGAGFIGSNFIRYMLSMDKDVEITNFDVLTYAGRLENLRDVEKNPRYKFIQGDIRERKDVEPLFEDSYDLVVNFAAETHVDRSIRDTGSFVLTDVYGLFVLLEAARKFNVERFLQISTDEVYGSIDDGSFTEVDPLDPSSIYSASKAAGDYIALAFYKTHGIQVLVTRSSNNYGPYQHPEKLIPKLILRALQKKPLPIYGDGRQVRNWLHVRDNCAALDLVARKGKAGEIYNIASSEERMNIDVAERILTALKKPRNLIRLVSDRPGHDFRYSISTERIKQLGWRPRTKLAEGLSETVNWYVNNEWWWRTLVKDTYFESDTPWLQ